MGNCSQKGITVTEKHPNLIRIMMDSGRILELEGPKFAREVIDDFPGYGIFGQGHMAHPLLDLEQLIDGQFYYLLPLGKPRELSSVGTVNEAEPVRMSSSKAMELVTKNLTNGSGVEVLAPPRKGVWKVKLVIGTKQLEEILSEQLNTEALIEQMRMAVKASTPRKSNWGGNLRPILSNVFKMSIDQQSKRVEALAL